MKLSEIKKGSIINCKCSDGSKYITFNHLDGMYSHCTTEKGATVHLSGGQELHRLSNGRYELGEETTTVTSSKRTVTETKENNSGDFLLSAVVGAATDSALLGGIVGGDFVGGALGDMFNGNDDGSWDVGDLMD